MRTRNRRRIGFKPRLLETIRIATAYGLLAVVLGGTVWYGKACSSSRPEAYLASPFVDVLRQRNTEPFVREIARLPSIDTPDREGMTPLLAVLCCGGDELAYVLARGADVNRDHPVRGTPLVAAMALGKPDAARLLLRYGADSARLTINGDTPLL